MRIRSTRLALLMGVSIIAAACGTGAGSSAPASEAPASTAPSEAPASTPPSEAPSAPVVAMKIGVQTDVGTVNDKNFNEYTYLGAKEGAAAIGADEPPVFVPKDASEYPVGIQSYVDGGFEIIVVSGFNAVPDATKFAKANPDVWFVGVDHSPCIDAEAGYYACPQHLRCAGGGQGAHGRHCHQS